MPAWSIRPVAGIPEVTPGTDIVELVRQGGPSDGDIVLVTSKIISKAEGRASQLPREEVIAHECVRTVAARGQTIICENHLGLIMAAAGVDASNVPGGVSLRLPENPDASAQKFRQALNDEGINAAVIITDTAGRPWRLGQTDIAIGVAGLEPMQSLAHQRDEHGNELMVTAPAVADELAGAAELASAKLGRYPICIVSGLDHLVLEPGSHGPGAAALIRSRDQDMFALGAREAVVAAVTGRDLDCFGSPASSPEVLDALNELGVQATAKDAAQGPEILVRLAGQSAQTPLLTGVIARAMAWQIVRQSGDFVVLAPSDPLHSAGG